LIKFLLKEIDRFGPPVFSKRELLVVSPEGLDFCLKQKILSYRQPTTDVERIGNPRCPHGCRLSAVEMEDGFEGVCLEHPDVDPILVDKEDLKRYVFSLPDFLERVRIANNIDGKVGRMSHGYYSLGSKEINGALVGFYYAPETISVEWHLFLSLKKGDIKDVWIILSPPAGKVKALDEKRALLNNGVISVSLLESMNLTTFELPIDKIIAELPKEYLGESRVTPEQEADYKNFTYKCRDRLVIPGTMSMKRSNDLIVNGHKIKMPDSSFRLLMKLVVGLRKGNGGWVRFQTEVGKYHVFDHLRKPLEGSLEDKDGKVFIENDSSQRYRISTHPDFVTYDRKKLIGHPNATIKALAKKLP